MTSDTEAYILRHTTPEPSDLKELVRESEQSLEYTDMLSGNQVGLLLRLFVRSGNIKRILEVGTFTGYSALWMADALPDDGELVTLEMNERYTEISDRFFSRDPYQRKIRQIMGPALETIDSLGGLFDMIFLDADKAQYPDYFIKLKPMLRRGGVLIVDNALWGGSVLQPDDVKSRAVDRLNDLVQSDPDFENTILPIRDGLLIAVKL